MSRLLFAAALLGLVAAGLALAALTGPKSSGAAVPGPGSGCTGPVTVGYSVAYSAAPAPGYKATFVNVHGIASPCNGAQLSVYLTQNGTPIPGAAGSATISGSSGNGYTTTVSMSTPPLAKIVTDVHVEIGEVPIPPECAGMKFSQVIYGTNGNDVINAGNQGALIFAGDGNDKVFGGNSDDCVVGGNGDDELHGGNGKDVILGGPGNDKLYGDNGNDTLNGGPETDACYGGNGTDTFTACETQVQ